MDAQDKQDETEVMADDSCSSLRILHLVRSLNVGGLEKVVVDLTRGLAKHGVTNYLGCLVEAGVWCDDADVAAVWCGDLEEHGALKTFFSLCRYIRKNRINLIHTHNSHPHKYGAFVSLVTGVPLVHTKHGRNWPDNPRWVWFSRQLSRLTEVIVPVSREIEKIVIDIEKVPQRKVVTILNGVEIDRCERPFSRTGSRTFVIGSIGRFSPEKQYPFLIRAFAQFVMASGHLPGNEVDAKLILVGDGVDRNNIEAEIDRCGVKKYVELPGISDDVHGCLDELDMFCLSSDQEGTSITLLEAGAAGLPSVVTDVGGNSEIVEDGVTGIVVPSGDEKLLCEAFCRMAQDGELRERMGSSARKRISEKYSLDAMVDQYIEVYVEARVRKCCRSVVEV